MLTHETYFYSKYHILDLSLLLGTVEFVILEFCFVKYDLMGF